jgi:hypothetical protein
MAQQFLVPGCTCDMERQTISKVRKEDSIPAEQLVYEKDMPLWRRYYQRVRKTIRFPRYYKETLNW